MRAKSPNITVRTRARSAMDRLRLMFRMSPALVAMAMLWMLAGNPHFSLARYLSDQLGEPVVEQQDAYWRFSNKGLEPIWAVAPTIVLKDSQANIIAEGGTYSAGMGPTMACFQAYTDTTLGAGDSLNSKWEWNFGDTGSTGNTIRGFAAGHWYATETAVSYSCTLVVTNVGGESATRNFTVSVAANTRTVQTDITVAPAANYDYKLDPTVTHTLSGNWASGANTNIRIRSSIPGTPVTIDWTGGTANPFAFQENNIALIDVNIISSNASAPTVLFYTGKFGETKYNYAYINVTSNLNCTTQCLTCSYNPCGVVIQGCDIRNPGPTGGQSVWVGDAEDARLMTVVDCYFEHNGGERCMRGIGYGVTIAECEMYYARNTSPKNALTMAAGGYWWLQTSTLRTINGTQSPLNIGHNNTITGDPKPLTDVVVERCLLKVDNYSNTAIAVAVGNDIKYPVTRCVIRNCICHGGMIVASYVDALRIYGVTMKQNIAVGAMFFNTNTNFIGHTGLTIGACLYSNPLLEYNSTGKTGGLVWIFSDDDLATEVAAINGIISSNPVASDSDRDVRIQTALNAITLESWATFNARLIGAENAHYDATLDSRYMPAVGNWASLEVTMPADMAQFQEDYYGNARGATWYAGAVDINSDISAPTATLDSENLAVSGGSVLITITATDNESGLAVASQGTLDDPTDIALLAPDGTWYQLIRNTAGPFAGGASETVEYRAAGVAVIGGIWKVKIRTAYATGILPTSVSGVAMVDGTQIGADIIVPSGHVNPRLDRLRKKFQFPRGRAL